MLEINTFLKSLKCSWIRRLFKDKKPWIYIFFEIHGNEVTKNMLDFGDKYMHNIVKHSNVFWKDVFQSYLTIIQASDNIIFKQKFFSMPVWYNTNICVGNKTIYVKLWYEHGVK